jgi:hypothetical protein
MSHESSFISGVIRSQDGEKQEVDTYFSTVAIMLHRVVALFLVAVIVVMLVSSQLLSDEQGTQVMIIAFI